MVIVCGAKMLQEEGECGQEEGQKGTECSDMFRCRVWQKSLVDGLLCAACAELVVQ